MIGMIAALATTLAPNPAIRIGSLQADSPNGISFIRSQEASSVVRIGWYEGDKLLADYGAIVEPQRQLRFGKANPNGSFGSLSWGIEGGRIEMKWACVNQTTVYISVRTTIATTLALQAQPFWEKSVVEWTPSDQKLSGKLGSDDSTVLSGWFNHKATVVPQPDIHHAVLNFSVEADKPLYIAIGTSKVAWPDDAEKIIRRAEKACTAIRPQATGPWGDFLAGIVDNMDQSLTYSPDNQRVAHIVSRGWCRPDGQVLFCWDSFFNGLLSSLNEPEVARNTVRTVLEAQLPNGLVANFSGRPWGVSADRSQPPVGAMCVWKMHQRWPSKAFLTEVYPKLVKWHDWWFSKRENKKATRDGNGDGLLEWGSENQDTQDARFESGLDDSPMFDGATMDGPNMTMNSVDLNALWAMDADYLRRIALAIGKTDDANRFYKERNDMSERMLQTLWNENLGMFCNRYWEPREIYHPVALEGMWTDGLQTTYYKGQNFEQEILRRKETEVHIDGNKLLAELPADEFSARWTGEMKIDAAGSYTFSTNSDDGVRLWIDDVLVIEDWTVHAPVLSRSKPIKFKKGQKVQIKLEYFQASGGATLNLAMERTDPKEAPQVFSERLAPCNFYPLMTCDVEPEQAERVMKTLLDPEKFWGEFVCPTVARNDPSFPNQNYWRGKVWGPTNYLMWLGLKRYASETTRREFAEKSVKLFMKNWDADGTCHENFLASGEGSSDPHYTWGALLNLIALEEIVDIEPSGKIRLNGTWSSTLDLKNVPLFGKRYDVEVRPGHTRLLLKGAVVMEAIGKVETKKL
jgi:glycogen debranching enzyme